MVSREARRAKKISDLRSEVLALQTSGVLAGTKVTVMPASRNLTKVTIRRTISVRAGGLQGSDELIP